MAEVVNPFARAAVEAVAAATGCPVADFTVTAPPRPELGDFAVACFPAARATKQPPPAVAARVAAEFTPGPLLAGATATGPFVNFRADRAAAFAWLCEATLGDGDLAPASVGAGKTVCIDYSSPNISKHLAYHHIRSTVIGHALAELHRALGWRVVGINHLGDWGTTHGMLIAAYLKWGVTGPLDVAALNGLYLRFREAMKTQPELNDEARGWFKKLEDGDPEARALWQQFRDVSWAEFQAAYDQLGVQFDEVRGESAYEADMPKVIELLEAKGLTSISEGALVVEIPGEKTPLLLRTGDGTTLYATRDLASAIYRWETYGFDRSLYVVDRGQGLHFKHLFAVLAMAGFAWASRCEHIPFGLVRSGGKKTGTRAGNVVLLKEVLAEATRLARDLVVANNPNLADAEIDAIATQVGVGAVVFANLAPQRDRDVDFDLEKVVSLEGDSGPYLQYSHARCASILRKGEQTVALDDATRAALPRLGHDAEWAVAKRLLDFGDVVARAAATCEPHILAHYLLDLAGDFSRWYTAGNGDATLRVLCDDADTRRARLALTAAVRTALARGLGLLGMGAPDVM
ncbi:MAG: arginine--tRNA ligase [Kofleriaceae bacterium]|nr:arginine--tRNA ligase [Myxococcales bacterium]MCB9562408.1 arginine--tRNA ligase [Kofleriaceae bacterium]